MHLSLKMLSGMANSEEPDQTAPESGSALFAFGILSETLVFKMLGHLPYPIMFIAFNLDHYSAPKNLHQRNRNKEGSKKLMV